MVVWGFGDNLSLDKWSWGVGRGFFVVREEGVGRDLTSREGEVT